MFGGERAQSEVIGTVLLLGLTIIVVGSTVALGSVALADSQETADLQRVEGAMTQIDSKASLVAHGESPNQRIQMDVGRTADFRVDDEAGWMRIEVETEDGTTNETVRLGTVTYERGEETVAYQGGGVWRSNAHGSWMVSPPEFHYRGGASAETLTLPLVTIEESSGAVRDPVVVSQTGREPTRLFPSSNGTNPLVGGDVTITVGSEYAEAWGRFFESRTSATVTDIDDETVRITLRTETVHPTLRSGVSATGASTLNMGGIETLYADSYNSSQGTYESQDSNDNADVQTRDEFKLTSGGGGGTDSITIRGNLTARSFNIPQGQSDKLNVTGEMREEEAFDELDPVSGAITQRISDVRALDVGESETRSGGLVVSDTNDTINSDTYVDGKIEISNATLTVSDGAVLHVSSGIDIRGDGRLEFDTSGGRVKVLSEGMLDMRENGAVRAFGGQRADLYVDHEIQTQDQVSITTANDTRLEIYNTDELKFEGASRIAADDDITSNLWVYSSADSIEIEGDEGEGVQFVGVFYAPESEVELENKMTIKGSFTFRVFDFENADIELHYDETLRDFQPFDGDSVPVVSHLHVSTHGVTLSAD